MIPKSSAANRQGDAPDGVLASRHERLLLLQVGRGLAAIAVAASHARLGTSAFVDTLPDWLMMILAHGALGVDFFFVLSGFIILNSHQDDPQGCAALKSYVLKRLSRVFIPYVPVCAIVIMSYLIFPTLSQANREWGWLTSIFLVPSRYPPALVAAWTLVHEVLFYSIFMLFFAGKRLFLLATIVWAVAILALSPPGGLFSPLFSTLLNYINLEFLFGMACALLCRRINRFAIVYAAIIGWLALAAGFGCVYCYFLTATGEGPDRLLFGLGASLVMLGMVLFEPKVRDRVPRAFVRLGDASYAIYLIHNPLISLTSRVATHCIIIDQWAGSLIFSMACVIGLGLLYHVLFEKPVLRFYRQIAKVKAV